MITKYCANSADWYVHDSQAQAYLALLTSEQYGSGVVCHEQTLLEEVLAHLVAVLPKNTHYVDLGPGDGQKTDFVLSHLHRHGVVTAYTAVDVQQRFLQRAEQVTAQKQISAQFHCMTFAEYFRQHKATSPTFFYLGATYGNVDVDFDHQLAHAMQSNDLVYISAGKCPDDIGMLVEEYANTQELFIPVALRHNITTEKYHIRFNEQQQQIEMGFIENDTFHVFGISKKPTVQQFKQRVTEHFDGTFFTNDKHQGFVGSVKK